LVVTFVKLPTASVVKFWLALAEPTSPVNVPLSVPRWNVAYWFRLS
jgi:hypothetical protein